MNIERNEPFEFKPLKMENLKQKNEVLIQITNHDLYDYKVYDIDTSGLISKGTDYRGNSRGYDGDLSIQLHTDGFYKTISGEFGTKHYEDEWGFIFISKSEIQDKIEDLQEKRVDLKNQIEDLKDLIY